MNVPFWILNYNKCWQPNLYFYIQKLIFLISHDCIWDFLYFHTDINECLSLHNPCDQICENTAGSFKCKCKPGFILDFDGKSCTGKINLTKKILHKGYNDNKNYYIKYLFLQGLPCQKLYAPRYGSISCSGYYVGDRCQYKCDAGYELVGRQFRTCLNQSIWDKGDSFCVGKIRRLPDCTDSLPDSLHSLYILKKI